MRPGTTALLVATALAIACEAPSDDAGPESSRPDTAGPAVAQPTAPAGPVSPDAADAPRVQAARAVVAFLRGDAPPDTTLLADSVTLHVAPEGGGDSRRVSRDALRDRSAWRVGRFSLVPPASLTELTTAPGRHLACVETSLATRAPDLAAHPHVGASLRPARPESCLQSWTLTFVFADPAPAVLTDVLYDQWEW